MEAGLVGASDRGVAGSFSLDIADARRVPEPFWLAVSRGGSFRYVQSSSRDMQLAQGGPDSSHWTCQQRGYRPAFFQRRSELHLEQAYLDTAPLALVTPVARLGVSAARSHACEWFPLSNLDALEATAAGHVALAPPLLNLPLILFLT